MKVILAMSGGLFSPVATLAKRAIYYADVFFCIFYIFNDDYLTPVSQKLMDRSLPKFQDL